MPNKPLQNALNWRRFWCSRDGKLPLFDGGYLWTGEDDEYLFSEFRVLGVDKLSDKKCLVLLGEPGMGKTSVLRSLYRDISTNNPKVHYVDLRSYGSEDRLIRDVFESVRVVQWANSDDTLEMVLDSLDECLLKISTVASLIETKLTELGGCLGRLRLRIACRTAEWPTGLEQTLERLWPGSDFGVYELAPLRRMDVQLAAEDCGVDAVGFMREIDRNAAVPLAIKPVTLRFLLSVFQTGGGFPDTRWELYERGCERLCEEVSQSRRGARLLGDLSLAERLTVASRIAAVMVFCGRSSVRTGLADADNSESVIHVDSLTGGTEICRGDQIRIDESAIRETLGTGLFSARGPECLGWAHQTYAEFLAARYVFHNQMPLAQVTSLLMHPADRTHVIPQLHEPAAWLASVRKDVLEAIADRDPQVLLRGDFAEIGDQTRERITGAMLRGLAAATMTDFDFGLRFTYPKLRHANLYLQLRPYIGDRSQNFVVRRTAIDIAEACEVRDLVPDLIQIALNPLEDYHIRGQAAHAIVEIGDNSAFEAMRPLAAGLAGDDPDDQLKGNALRALWQGKLLTSAELFGLITRPKQSHFYGAYRAFLASELLPSMGPEHLGDALAWVLKQPVRHDRLDTFGELADGILAFAWAHMDEHISEVTQAVIVRMKEHLPITRRVSASEDEPLWTKDDPRRLRLLESMVAVVSQESITQFQLVYGTPRLVFADDFAWLLDRLAASRTTRCRQVWAALAALAYWEHLDPKKLDLLLSSLDRLPELGAAFGSVLDPVSIDSQAAAKERERFREIRSWQQRPEPPLIDPPPLVRVTGILDTCDAGDIGQWWKLNPEMTLEPRSAHYGNEHEADLRSTPVWKAGTPELRARIVRTAEAYLCQCSAHTDEWFGRDIEDRRAMAGYRALLLLHNESPARVGAMPAAVWEKWTPILVSWVIGGRSQEELQLLRTAYQNAPHTVVEFSLKTIHIQNAATGYLYVLERLELCWDNRLRTAMLGKATERTIKPSGLSQLLEALLKHGSADAKAYAESLVTDGYRGDALARERSLVVANVLLEHGNDAGWGSIWPAMVNAPDWGKDLMSRVAVRHPHTASIITSKLSENAVADLYAWLLLRYPVNSDPPRAQGVHTVQEGESIADFREGVLDSLRKKGSFAACREIARLGREHPEASFLKWVLVQACQTALQATWTRPEPDDIPRLAHQSHARLVGSADDLMDVVIESLNRWQELLQGTPPAAFQLWNRLQSGYQRPKEEEEISNALVIHLRNDLRGRGIIMNREVEIRRGEKHGKPGERTDVQVDAVRKQSNGDCDTISVIIEVNGCWNKELDTAMESQLSNRYLADNPCQHGVYLAVWMMCQHWDPSDYRRSVHAKKGSVAGLREALDKQATSLSNAARTIKAVVINATLR